MAASATFALKVAVWFRRGRLFMVSPDSLGTACPLSGRNSTYRSVQISETSSERACGRQVDDQLELSRLHDLGASWAPLVRGSHPSTLSLCRVVHHSIFAHPTYATGEKHGLASTRPNHGRSAAPPIAAVVGP